VLDQTCLTGRYDIVFTTTPNGDWPGILEGQLGLKLEVKKVPRDVVVINGVMKPSEN
jgi:uncharacterized protein (TIGR03435 family)